MAEIERISGVGFEAGLLVAEVFKATMKVPAAERDSFLKNTAVFMRRFFEDHGHKVNHFNITVEADSKVKAIVRRSKGDVVVEEVVVHVVQGGIGPGGTAYDASSYI